jgi:CheY-like chemotaxis protein
VTTPHQVLIVEDDTNTRVALGEFLEMHGYSTVLAANGAEGLSKLRSGLRPCLILLDLMMPEKNGFQFRTEQVVDARLADIPVAVYSGNPEARAESVLLGAVAHLGVPINVDELLRIVKAYS